MKLLYQTHSPYARKVLVAAHELGLQHRIEVVHHDTSPTRRNDEVFALNPLGKVPVLLVDDGPALFDSGVICEYLDGLHSGVRIIPVEHDARFRALRRQALAIGMADAGIAARWEAERRPEASRWPPMLQGQLEKLAAACDLLEQELGDAPPVEAVPDIGDIALASTLSWIAFRHVYPFAGGRPRLSAWYARFSQRPSMLATTLSGDTPRLNAFFRTDWTHRPMSSLWTDLLFLHGHITDARLARRLDAAKRPAPPPVTTAPAKSSPGGWLRRLCQGIGDGQLRRQ